MGFDIFGLGGSQSSGSSQSTSSGQSSSFVDPTQAPFLDFLRNSALSGFGGFQQGQQQFGQFAGGLGQQAGQIGGQQNPFIQQFMQQSQGNPELVQAQTANLSQNLSDQFLQQINPGITAGSVGAGQLGGGRQGAAQGMAIQGAQDALTSGALGFQQQDNQFAQQSAGLGSQAFGQSQQAGLQGIAQQFGMGQGAFQSQFDPLFALAQIFGGPNNLQQSSQQSQSTAKNKSTSLNMGFG